jgi:ligand-binding sensor domain-containing protein/two-component sensor histidine kinase
VKLFAIVACLVSTLTVGAALGAASPEAPPSYSRRVWQSADGLPEDLAQALAQTPDGYLWIGTSGGLVRFDGVRFRTFDRAVEPAFRDDSVYSLLTARDGTLWAGTEGGGLVRYKGGSFRAFGPSEGLGNGFVRAIFEDREGTLWVGTDAGLFRMQNEMLTRVDGRGGVPEMNVHSIWQDREGRLLVGGAGLLVITGGRTEYYSSGETLADNSIRTIRETADGTVWIGTISGLRRLAGGVRGNPFTVRRMIDGMNVCVLHETRRGQLWIGTYGRGAMQVDADRKTALAARPALPHDNVLAVFEDREENVWIGTQGGLLRLSPGAATTITTEDRAPLSISTVYEDPGLGILVTALNGRLFRVSQQTLVPVPLPAELAALPVRNVFRDSRQRLWIGTDGQGVALLADGKVSRWTMREGLVNDFVRAFCEDRGGGVWIGTDGWLSHWREGVFSTFSAEGLVYASIRGLLLDRAGRLWVATDGGLSRFEAGAFVRDPLLERLRGQKVWALHEDPDGGLWIGTQGMGLFLLKNGALRQFTTEEGLASNKVHFIAEDSGHRLWTSGPSGIVSVSRADLEAPASPGQIAMRVYNTAEGLSTDQMGGGVQSAGFLSVAGELWLPSTRGVVRIATDVAERGSPPPVLAENVIADDRDIPISPAMTLPPGRGKLEIHYTAVRLRSPEGIRFKYWMEGFDREWTAAGTRRVAYYTNLPSGRYRFHVVAYETNAPGNQAEQVLDIEWRPHFYETSWFMALCGAFLSMVAWGGYRLHVRGLRRRFAAVLEERNRLAREMHDTLIQGCVGVSALLEAASHAEEVSPAMSHDLLDRARTEVRATVDEARLAVWNLRHGVDEGVGLAEAISRLAQRIGLEAHIGVKVDTVGAPLALSAEVQSSLLMLVREALQNAVRHAAPENLSVLLRFERRRLEVEIVDDGRGFDSSAVHADDGHHYGLIGMRERVERAGGEFHLTSVPGKGTEVRLSVPVSP